MNIVVEIIITGILTLYILIETIRINTLRKDKNALSTGLASLLLIMFGLYLCIKNGLTLDYGTEEEKLKTHALAMCLIGTVSIGVGLLSIGISIVKYVIWRIRKASA